MAEITGPGVIHLVTNSRQTPEAFAETLQIKNALKEELGFEGIIIHDDQVKIDDMHLRGYDDDTFGKLQEWVSKNGVPIEHNSGFRPGIVRVFTGTRLTPEVNAKTLWMKKCLEELGLNVTIIPDETLRFDEFYLRAHLDDHKKVQDWASSQGEAYIDAMVRTIEHDDGRFEETGPI